MNSSFALNNINTTTNNNIVGYYNDSPQEEINNFMALRNCKNTTTTYWKHYSHMFMNICTKEIKQLTWNDIKSITKKRVKAYRVSMMDQGFATSTINQRVYACKKLWKEFIENERVSDNAFELEDLQEVENHYDSLTSKEIEMLFDYCLGLKHKPTTQMLYFKFLFVLTCRKHVAQNITWKDITREKDINTGQEFWVIKYHDKTSNCERAITDQFYNQLKENYENEKESSGKIFNVHYNTILKTLKDFCKKYNITRNIKPHSIKGSSTDYIQNILEDINVTALAAGHSNIQTTYKSYMNKNKNKSYSNQPSIILHQEEFAIDKLKELDKNMLIELIERAGMETITTLCLELNKLEGKGH